MNFDKYEFAIDIEKQSKHIRFKQVEERSLKELFSRNQSYSKKIVKEFLAAPKLEKVMMRERQKLRTVGTWPETNKT